MDCLHPDWPVRMVALAGADGPAHVKGVAAASSEPQVIRAGERVRLWRQDATARIETSGAAEESGAEGQRIRVRLVKSGLDSGAGKEFVMGVVRGSGSVEILR
jgi:flagella basal body P-ring formation protein FlgA